MSYQLLRDSTTVRRLSDDARIPEDLNNVDYLEFLRWRDGWTEILEGGTEVQHPPHEPLPADPAPEPTQESLDIEAARNYAKLRALVGMTPAEVSAWVDANVTNLASVQDAIKTLAIGLSVLGRRI